MGYTASGKLERFGELKPMRDALERTTERVGEQLLERAQAHTPIAKPPPGVAVAEWERARGGRKPGTLRRSWQVGRVTLEADGTTYTVPVFTLDRIAPHVEWPTVPHIIVPRNPRGWLRFWDRYGKTIYAQIVHHPGTHGSYMLTTALAEIALEWQAIGAEEMQRWAREQTALVAA
jgi:hypothetical protein